MTRGDTDSSTPADGRPSGPAMRRICVYCGSNPGKNAAFVEAAAAFAKKLASMRIGIIYGGGRVGMMGAIADAALNAGGQVEGIIPTDLVRREVAHRGLTKLHLVDSMHERKAMMADLSDGFIAMPGGLGTLEELFEILTWAQLGYHEKPVGLLNVGGYFDALIRFLDHAVEQEFLRPAHRALLLIDDDADALLTRMKDYRPAKQEKWLRQKSL